MTKTNNKQINTTAYWETMYFTEFPIAQERVINERFDRIMQILNPYKDADSILDVGCGWGEFLKKLSEAGFKGEKWGVDIVPELLYKASRRFPGFNFVMRDAEDLPFEKDSFDIVFCGETLEHLNDPHSVIKKLKQIAKKVLVVTVPFERMIEAPEHMHYFSLEDFKQYKPFILEKQGSNIICAI